jgi:hypothetical protein
MNNQNITWTHSIDPQMHQSILQSTAPQQHTGLDPKAWISELMGTAGMIGGGILGGPLGAAAGGALLGGAGKYLEQKAHGEQTNWGQIGQEAGTNALFGYGPLKALGKVTGVTTGKLLAGAAGKDLASAAASREGSNLLGQAWGIHQATNIGGGQALGLSNAQKLQQFLINRVGVPTTADALTAQAATGSFKDQVGKQIGTTLSQNATTFDKPGLLQNLKTEFSNVIGAGQGGKSANIILPTDSAATIRAKQLGNTSTDITNKSANDILTRVQNAKTTQDLWQVRKDINAMQNFNRTSQAATPVTQSILDKASQTINKELTSVHPELKTQFTDFSQASTAHNLLGKAAANPPGAQLPILGNQVGGRVIQRGKAILGGTMQKMGSQPTAQTAANTFIPKPGSFAESLMNGGAGRTGTMANLKPSNIGSALGNIQKGQIPAAIRGGVVRQMGAGLYGGMTGPVSGNPADQTAQLNNPNPDTTNQDITQGMNPYPKINLLYDIQNDPANATNYLKYYNQVQQVFGPQTSKMTQQQQASSDVQKLTQDAMQQLQSGAVKTGPFGILGKLEQAKGAINMADPATLQFNTTVANLMATIARARAGTAFTPNEQKLLEQYTPHIGDSYQQLVVKLNALQQQFGSPGSSTGAAGNQSNSQQLTDLLMQMSQGAQ